MIRTLSGLSAHFMDQTLWLSLTDPSALAKFFYAAISKGVDW